VKRPHSTQHLTTTQTIAAALLALDAWGWRISEFRPVLYEVQAPSWRVTIVRVDHDASMTVTATDLEAALADLVRYAVADREPDREPVKSMALTRRPR
jgi:hypothetical protein